MEMSSDLADRPDQLHYDRYRWGTGATCGQRRYGRWNELAAAFKKLGALSAYREKRTLSSGTIVLEIVPPHSYILLSKRVRGRLKP